MNYKHFYSAHEFSLPPPRLLHPLHLSGIDHLLQALVSLGGFACQVPLSAKLALIDVLRTLVGLKIAMDVNINQGGFRQVLCGVLVFSGRAFHNSIC